MSEDPRTNLGVSDQDPKTQESSEEIEDGYETPTSEEHKIPAVPWSCPPPPPKKRKRLFLARKINIRNVEVFKGRIVEEEEIESFFNLFAPQSRAAPPLPSPPPPPVPESEPDQGTSPKKRCSD